MDKGETRQSLKDKHYYDWSEVAYLFEDEIIPRELLQITDPIEYNYLIVRLKKEFNEKYRSDYLRYMHLDLPYHSRRDDLGGVITDQDWNAFTRRLEGVIDKVKKKRARIVRRRKKKGKKLMPRATLFKPPKREKLDKNPLWKEVYMKESSDDDDGSASEVDDREVFQMLKDTMIAKGIKTEKKMSKTANRITTPQVKDKNEGLSLPPIDGHKSQVKIVKKKKMSVVTHQSVKEIELKSSNQLTAARRGESRGKNKLRTAAQNYIDTSIKYPPMQQMMNIHYKDHYNDIFQKEAHQAGRTIAPESPMTQKLDRNYAPKLREQIREAKVLKPEGINE